MATRKQLAALKKARAKWRKMSKSSRKKTMPNSRKKKRR